ncbi:major facilitator superfamily domain-containing protein [Roridomyces roridus]|uniref:Major facilitator superfamily domain-containing protein n=1 Tax=Roridomyces roridus TaxID=1738132 RepID=A0AAD7FM35_9AGAR|nr:major facilitator superfamily domain-containing protein [Roridomyces roridus]
MAQDESASDKADTVETGTVVPPHHDTQAQQEKRSEAPGTVFPEGGLQAWATVAGAFLVQFCGFGYTTSFGVYQDFYVRDYLTNMDSSAISWIGSVNAFIIIAGGLLAGRLYDRGHFYILMRGGAVMLTFSLFMLSLCKPGKYYQIFLAQAIGAGIGSGMMYIPSIAVVSHYFHKRRAFAMSIVAAGSSLGAVVHPIMLNNTLRSHLGFGNAVRASAGLVGGMLTIACLLMHPRLPPPTTHLPFWKSIRRFVRDPPYVLVVAALTIFTVGFYFPLFYLQLDAVKHGIDETFSFYALVIMNASSFVGRLAPGPLANKLGVINIGTAASGGGAVLILCMIALKSLASVIVIAIIYGFFAGIFVTMMAPLMAVLTTDLGELGLRMGFGFFIVAFGGLIGPPIHGALLTSRFIWWRPALFSGIMAFAGFGFFVATAVAVRRRDSRAAREEVDADEKAAH